MNAGCNPNVTNWARNQSWNQIEQSATELINELLNWRHSIH